jgi:nicotinamidase-related amidase
VHSAAEVVSRASELAIAFRTNALPVVLVNVDRGAPGRTEGGGRLLDPPASWVALVPELSIEPTDYRVTKRTWGAFTNTNLFETLSGLGITHVVIAGLMTSKGVESTARFASELGFNVTVAVDAISDTKLMAHENSVANVFPELGETGTTVEILALLPARAH